MAVDENGATAQFYCCDFCEQWCCSLHLLRTAGIFCRLQVAGCGLKFNYNWKTAGTKDTYIHQGFLHNVVGVFHMVKTRATSSFGKYIQQPFQMIFQMFSGYFR